MTAAGMILSHAALALALAGCARSIPDSAPTPVAVCAAGDTTMVRDVVYFGRNRPDGGVVSDAEWHAFLAEIVTPRFPAGLTVVEAIGHWRGEGGAIETEHTEILTLLHDRSEAARRSVGEIATEYKRRFRQEAVLRERMTTCARFE